MATRVAVRPYPAAAVFAHRPGFCGGSGSGVCRLERAQNTMTGDRVRLYIAERDHRSVEPTWYDRRSPSPNVISFLLRHPRAGGDPVKTAPRIVIPAQAGIQSKRCRASSSARRRGSSQNDAAHRHPRAGGDPVKTVSRIVIPAQAGTQSKRCRASSSPRRRGPSQNGAAQRHPRVGGDPVKTVPRIARLFPTGFPAGIAPAILCTSAIPGGRLPGNDRACATRCPRT